MKKTLAGLTFFVVLFTVATEQVQALTISPVRVEVSGDPGQSLRGELELYNEQRELKRFFTSFENFEPQGESGSPRFTGSSEGLATWMSAQAEVTVSPEEKKVIPYTIQIPTDAEPGGYFAAVFLGEQDPTQLEAGEVSIGGKLGVLILLRVNGDIKEEAGISNFKTEGARFFSSLPITLSYRFANDGGDRVVPLGDIVIKNTFGGVTKTLSANVNEGNVLPSSARTFSAVWEPHGVAPTSFFATALSQVRNFHLGLYTADIHLVYGAKNSAADASYSFVVIPWHLLTIVTLLLSALFVLVRKYNSWIVARSRA